MIDINFNVVLDKNSNKEIANVDFTPIKNKESDIAYDVRANSIITKSGDIIIDWVWTTIMPNSSIVLGLGFSVNLPEKISLVPAEKFDELLVFIRKMFSRELSSEYFRIENMYNKLSEINDMPNIDFYPSSEMHSRSGLFFKSGITSFNGQIDNTYGNEIRVKLTNNSDKPFIINYGDRIGQIEFKLVPSTNPIVNNVETHEELNNNARGAFGSSGVK